jgi:acetyl esterase/lipase
LNKAAKAFCSLAFAILSSACSPVGLLNATIPTLGLSITRDVAYAPGPRRGLDIYRPEDTRKTLPVVVFFYGGSWNSGAKEEYLFAASALARQGFVVMVPDYRVYPQARYPEFLQDCAAAVVWAARHAGEYGGDANNLFLIGHSAGAYNVAMLTLDPTLLRDAGGSTEMIRGAVTLAGPFDFLPIVDPQVRVIFAPAGDLMTTQPIHYAAGPHPPMLLLAGADDETVLPRNTIALARALRADNGDVQDKIYPGIGHVAIILSFAPWFRGIAPALRDSVAFIRAHCGVSPTLSRLR